MASNRISWPLLPALVLLSCAGLVGLLVSNLWSAVQVADSRAALQARQQADFAAVAVRACLRHPDLVPHLPVAARFSVERGVLVVPPAVGWLEPPRFPGRADLDVLVRDKLDRLPTMPKPAAQTLLGTLVHDTGTPSDHRQWLTAWAAWWAHRHLGAGVRDDYLRALDQDHGGAAPAATILLHAEVYGSVPPWAATRIPLLPSRVATPLMHRLRERGIQVRAMVNGVAAATAQRRTLHRAKELLPGLRGAPDLVLRRVGDDELLLFHGSIETAGTGALLTRAHVRALLGELGDAPWTNLPTDVLDHLDDGSAPDVIDVVPGFLAVRPRHVTDQGLLGGPLGAGLLVLALAALTATGMWLFFRSVRREADAARVRSEFLTMVTHELKTPLAGIRLLAEMLQDGHVLSRDQQQDYYNRLTSESVRLSMLIENVLDLGRMERGERAYDLRPFDLDELVTEAVELFRPIADRAGLRIERTQAAAARVHGDRNAILQCLLNVLDNARKYAADGGRLDVTVAGDGEQCTVEVRDFGPGIEPAERRMVFERFERGTRHRDGNTPGVGLGLYLSRILVRNHGGELEAATPPDAGAGIVFRLRLPAQPNTAAEPSSTSTPIEPPPPQERTA